MCYCAREGTDLLFWSDTTRAHPDRPRAHFARACVLCPVALGSGESFPVPRLLRAPKANAISGGIDSKLPSFPALRPFSPTLEKPRELLGNQAALNANVRKHRRLPPALSHYHYTAGARMYPRLFGGAR